MRAGYASGVGSSAARIGRLIAGALAVTLAALACSTGGAAPAPRADAGPSDAGPPEGAGAELTVTMAATVKPGDDLYRCKYVAVPAAASGATSFFVGATHAYGDGCHHILVFRTDLATLPPGQDAERDCFSPDDVMPHARAQVYGAQSKTGAFAMPDGAGLALAAGEVLLVQVHYLDAKATAVDARATLTLRTAAGVTQRAGAFFFADPFIDIGAGQRGRAMMRCAFPEAATLLAVSGNAHARSTDFSAFVDPSGGPASTSTFYRAPGAANPLPLQTRVPVPAGGTVRFACTFDNARGTTELLAGPRSATDEACVLSGLYVPDQGDAVGACRAAPGGFGTGAATCAEARACVDACPAGSAPPPDLGLGTGAPADPCWQRCIARSCSDASQLLFAVRACLASKCSAECAADAGAADAGSACEVCAQSSCAREVTACAADTCP